METDLIITYVNFRDKLWRDSYERTMHRRLTDDDLARYRAFGTLRYLFRGVAKFMPWVNNVYLVVASESQVPFWLNRKTVKVITHDKFIPRGFLPTFNSCTIESFFWRIEGLADQIIYCNDDTFPIAPLEESDFYEEGTPKTAYKFHKNFSRKNMFRKQCKNAADLCYWSLVDNGYEAKENPAFFKPDHSMSAIMRKSLEEVGRLCGPKIPETISRVRAAKNINQHIYLYYQYFTDNYINQSADYVYMTFINGLPAIKRCIIDQEHKILCLNDVGSTDYKQEKEALQEAFNHLFPTECKYENGLVRIR